MQKKIYIKILTILISISIPIIMISHFGHSLQSEAYGLHGFPWKTPYYQIIFLIALIAPFTIFRKELCEVTSP